MGREQFKGDCSFFFTFPQESFLSLDILVVSKITNRRSTRVLPTASIIIFYKLLIMLQKIIVQRNFIYSVAYLIYKICNCSVKMWRKLSNFL